MVVTKSEHHEAQHHADDSLDDDLGETCASLDGSASCCSVPAAKKATAPANPILSIIGMDELENGGQIVTQATERTKASIEGDGERGREVERHPCPDSTVGMES